ncbi:PilZ domain-containing protein [Marinospirillum perlucidum]|uniref:PilZ domain-containing protein n=1 Tax=Marinospirillum perlucidum TaxID=1982602 RepID=UPI000DF44B00|nr:PilZ domain-containing protein [Marinospirillum perlucidum]
MSQPMTLDTQTQPARTPRFIRKRYPLLSLSLPVTFKLEGDNFRLETAEISHEEVRVNCPAAQIPRLVPRTAHHRPDEKILHQVFLELDGKETLALQLQVAFCRRYSQKEFKVGFRFCDIPESDQRKLQRRLEKALSNQAKPASMLN